MNIEYRQNALNTIYELAYFVEGNNTKGSGDRFIDKFFDHIEKYALPNVQYALCRYSIFHTLGYSCIFYNDWVIAFKIINNTFIVYEVVLGTLFYE